MPPGDRQKTYLEVETSVKHKGKYTLVVSSMCTFKNKLLDCYSHVICPDAAQGNPYTVA